MPKRTLSVEEVNEISRPAKRTLTVDEVNKISQEIPEPVEKPNTYAESLIRGGLQGVSFGLADEALGGAKTGWDVLTGPTKIKDIVAKYRELRDRERFLDDKARRDNPATYTTGELGGGVVSTLLPGGAWMQAGKAATLGQKLGTAAKVGALIGAGTSTADLTKGELGEFGEDVAAGAGTGAVTQGILSGLGKAIKSTPKIPHKLANIVLNTPEEITETYIKNRAGVLNAPKRFELGRDIGEEGLERLKKEVTEGSQASRDILDREGIKFRGGDIAALYTKKAKDIAKRSEGVMTDPQRIAAYQMLVDTAKKFRAGVPPAGSKPQPSVHEAMANAAKGLGIKVPEMPRAAPPLKPVPRILSANRIKDEIQSLDRLTDWETGAGKFGRVDDAIKKELRSSLSDKLKRKSPAYAKQMLEVAKDTELLDEASNIAKSPQGWSNVFRRVETDQYGAGQLPRETLEKLDARLGTNFLEKAKLSNAREAFDKSVTNGSMNVNKFSNLLKDVPGIKYLAPLVGATVDKYGRKMTLGAADLTIAFNQLLKKEGVQAYIKGVDPLMKAAAKGNASAILTLQFLSKSNGIPLQYDEYTDEEGKNP